MTDPPQPILTAEERQEAESLMLLIKQWRRSGIREMTLYLDDALRARPAGHLVYIQDYRLRTPVPTGAN